MSDSTTSPAGLDHLREVIHERTLDVLGTYHDKRWHNRTARLADANPATLAAELAEAIADGVTLQLAGDPGWPDNPVLPARPDELMLTPKQIDRYGSYLWYQPAAQIAGLHHEAKVGPGWPFLWVSQRLRDTGALGRKVGGRPTPAVHDDVASAHVRRDGSVTIVLTDGTVREFGPLEASEHLPETVVRTAEVDSHEGHYLTPEQLQAKLAERERAEKSLAVAPDRITGTFAPKTDRLLCPDGKRYALRLDRKQIIFVIAHFHWQSQLHHNVNASLEKHFPGWTVQELSAVFYQARIIDAAGALHRSRWRRRVMELWISAAYDFLVVHGTRRPAVYAGRVDDSDLPPAPDRSSAAPSDAPPTSEEASVTEDAGGGDSGVASLDGFFDLDEEAQTDWVMRFLGQFSPNPEVREQSARQLRGSATGDTADEKDDQ